MTLDLLMNKDIQKIDHTATVRQAALQMQEKKIGSLLVEKEGQYLGIITETDIVRKAVAGDQDLKSKAVSEIMSRPVITLDEKLTPQDAHDQMGDQGVRHLGITHQGEIVGIISVRDILLYFKRQSEPKLGID